MSDPTLLVKRFNIDIPVYTGELENKRDNNLEDDELCNDIVRQYFLGKIKRVTIKSRYQNGERKKLYFFEEINGELVNYIPQHITEETIKKIMRDKRGGCRKGAGRNPIAGLGSVPIRVPKHLKTEIMAIIDMYAQFTSNRKYLLEANGRTSELERRDALKWMDMVSEYEHTRIENLKEQKRLEEENKRQLKLFPDL